MKVSADIRYIKTCKKEQLMPTLAFLNNVSFKLRKKIAGLIMEAEMKNKHLEKRKLRKEMRKSLNLIILKTVFHQLNVE